MFRPEYHVPFSLSMAGAELSELSRVFRSNGTPTNGESTANNGAALRGVAEFEAEGARRPMRAAFFAC